ncbi:MAG: hypothetical protein R3A44_10250 [Caldilineaceae bacterium]
MKKVSALVLLLSIGILSATVTFAQSGGQTIPPAAEPSIAFITLNLEAGFPLDPMILSVNGGGDVDANTLDEKCAGYINPDPVVTLNWSGQAEFVEVFFFSDHDPTLVIQTPDGGYACNDDANDLLLDPSIQADNPPAGQYKIWVGSYAPEQLIPGFLVLTTKPDVNIGTLNIAELVKRELIAEDELEHHEANTAQSPAKAMKLQAEPAVEVDEEASITESLSVSGTVAAFGISVPGQFCNGFIHAEPDFAFNWQSDAEFLRIFFEGDDDATLFVEGPDGAIRCNDDVVAGENLNPVVDIEQPLSGQYYVFVGRLDLEAEVNGTLTVSQSANVQPKVLKGDD